MLSLTTASNRSLGKVRDITLGLNTVWINNKPKRFTGKLAQRTHSVFCIQLKNVLSPPRNPCSARGRLVMFHLHPSHHGWWRSVLMPTIHKAFPLRIRFYSALSEIFLTQWAIKIITFNHILQLLHSTEGGLSELGPDANIFCCD